MYSFLFLTKAKIPTQIQYFTGNIGVHENVCAKMREKLVSEVKANIQKLKVKRKYLQNYTYYLLINMYIAQYIFRKYDTLRIYIFRRQQMK